MRVAAERGALRECAPGGAALAAALAPVLADPAEARKLGAAGRRYVREEHDWDRLARRYLRIYEEGLRAS
jgi:glycosyltransferase involved in cell wall biosynthesis